MAENVSAVHNGTPLLERRLEMPQLVKALDRAIDDERWDRVEGLISRIHEMGLGMLERREFVDIHHQVKKLAKTLVVLSKRPGAQKHRYFLCQSMSRLMQLSAVAALSEPLPLVDRIPDEDLKQLFELAQEIEYTDPGFYYELGCFYSSYWFYCSSYDREGIVDFAKYVAKAVKAVVSLKDLDPGDLEELTKELQMKFKMLPEKWAIESLRIRGLSYTDMLRYVDLFLRGKEAGWFGMGYVVELARVAHSRTIDSISAHHYLRQLACLKGKQRWQLRFFACQQLMSLTGHPQCVYNQKLLQARREKGEKGEKHPRVLALLNNQPAYNCGEALLALSESELEHILRSHQLECLYVEVVQLRQMTGGVLRELQHIRIQMIVNNRLIRRSLRMQRTILKWVRAPAARLRPKVFSPSLDKKEERFTDIWEQLNACVGPPPDIPALELRSFWDKIVSILKNAHRPGYDWKFEFTLYNMDVHANWPPCDDFKSGNSLGSWHDSEAIRVRDALGIKWGLLQEAFDLFTVKKFPFKSPAVGIAEDITDGFRSVWWSGDSRLTKLAMGGGLVLLTALLPGAAAVLDPVSRVEHKLVAEGSRCTCASCNAYRVARYKRMPLAVQDLYNKKFPEDDFKARYTHSSRPSRTELIDWAIGLGLVERDQK